MGDWEYNFDLFVRFKDKINGRPHVTISNRTDINSLDPFGILISHGYYEGQLLLLYEFREIRLVPYFSGISINRYFKDVVNPTQNECDMFQMLTGKDYWIGRL